MPCFNHIGSSLSKFDVFSENIVFLFVKCKILLLITFNINVSIFIMLVLTNMEKNKTDKYKNELIINIVTIIKICIARNSMEKTTIILPFTKFEFVDQPLNPFASNLVSCVLNYCKGQFCSLMSYTIGTMFA